MTSWAMPKARPLRRGEIDASGQGAAAEALLPRFHRGRRTAHLQHSRRLADFHETEDISRECSAAAARPGFRLRGRCLYRLRSNSWRRSRRNKRITLRWRHARRSHPPGTRDKQVLRLRGKVAGTRRRSARRRAGGDRGRTAQVLRPQGDDIHLEFPISLPEAVLGAKLDVSTPTGPVRMTVPKGANTGTVLRLRARARRAANKPMATNT